VAAPAPTLAWLKSQAAEASPRLDELRLIFRAWGWWIRSNEERQHRDAVGEAIALLSSNAAVRADERTLAGLVRFAGEAASPAAAEFVLASLGHESASVRGQATVAAARIGAADAAWHQKCRDALVARAAKETDPAAAVMLSEAADEYRDDPAMGEAMLRMMRRMQNAEVQASILYSAAVAGWPQRDAMIVESLEAGSGGVVGVALQAVAQKPTPAALEPALKLLEAFAAAEGEAANEDLPQPQLIDALGALRAGPAARALGAWLESPNPAVRLKIVLALERIGGEVAREALSRQLREETNETVMEHLIGVAARMRLKGADGMLLALASDATAPPRLRRSAMVALGHFDSPDVRAALEVMAEHPADPVAEDVLAAAGREHRLDEARVLVAVSRLRLTRGQAGRAELELAESAGPAAQLTVLSTLAELGLDDPAIARGLESSDYAVLLFAVRAAERADAQKYRPRIERLRASPWIRAILGTPLDTLGLEAAFDRALAAGEETP
jgi:HEAT repeat protein